MALHEKSDNTHVGHRNGQFEWCDNYNNKFVIFIKNIMVELSKGSAVVDVKLNELDSN